MTNDVLNTEFDIEVLKVFTYAQLRKFTNILVETVNQLENIKKMAVLNNNDARAVEYQRYIHNASDNRNNMLGVMLIKEEDTCEHTSVSTIWLN